MASLFVNYLFSVICANICELLTKTGETWAQNKMSPLFFKLHSHSLPSYLFHDNIFAFEGHF